MNDVKRKDDQEYVTVQMEKESYYAMKELMERSTQAITNMELYYKMLWVVTSALNNGHAVTNKGTLLLIDGVDIYNVIQSFDELEVFEEGEYGQ